MSELLRMQGISKSFGRLKALDGVDLTVTAGEIHALLGENGAGKSTLMNILYGLYQADAGSIHLQGRALSIGSPKDAIRAGIGMVHQHFMLVPTLTVAENLVLGEAARGGLLDLDRARRAIRDLGDEYGLRVEPDVRVAQLTVGEQQRAEIIKALYRGADLLILDEPTAVLTPGEVDQLLEILRRLTARGKTVIFITHKLQEVIAAADRVTVLRLGCLAGSLPTAETSRADLAHRMVGRELATSFERNPVAPAVPALAVEGLEVRSRRGLPALRGISLKVRAGEIVGIAGVDGNGQEELVEVIAGLRPAAAGSIRMGDRDLTGASPRQRLAAGLGHIPGDRHRSGLVLDMTVSENLILHTHYRTPFARWGHLSFRKVAEQARNLIQRFDIRAAGAHLPVRLLSGGNQQKVVLARELAREPRVLIASHPSRGLDVGATESVHREIMAARARGCAVLLISAELDEILALSDRIAVLFEGRIAGVMDRADADVQRLGLMMAGAAGQAGAAHDRQERD